MYNEIFCIKILKERLCFSSSVNCVDVPEHFHPTVSRIFFLIWDLNYTVTASAQYFGELTFKFATV